MCARACPTVRRSLPATFPVIGPPVDRRLYKAGHSAVWDRYWAGQVGLYAENLRFAPVSTQVELRQSTTGCIAAVIRSIALAKALPAAGFLPLPAVRQFSLRYRQSAGSSDPGSAV